MSKEGKPVVIFDVLCTGGGVFTSYYGALRDADEQTVRDAVVAALDAR